MNDEKEKKCIWNGVRFTFMYLKDFLVKSPFNCFDHIDITLDSNKLLTLCDS